MKKSFPVRSIGLFVTVMFAFGSLLSPACREPEIQSAEEEKLPDPGPDGGCPSDIEYPFDNTNSPYRGGLASVDVVIDATTDFYCPYCAMFTQMVDELWQNEEYQNRARIYHHDFVVHSSALLIHQAARAVAKQGMENFWLLHDAIFSRTYESNPMSLDDVVTWVENNLEIDMQQFHADRSSTQILDEINAEMLIASDSGVTGTPSVFVCGVKLKAWGDLKSVVDMYLGIEAR